MGARPVLFASLLLLLTLAPAVRSVAQTAAPSAAARPAAADLPRVRLVATGGTISNRTGGRLTAEELVKSMPNVDRYARPEFEQFTNLASSQLSLEQYLLQRRGGG